MLAVFLCSMFLIMSQLMWLLLLNLWQLHVLLHQPAMAVTMAPISMEQAAASGQHIAVLLPPLIPRDTIRSIIGLTTVPQQQPQPQMPSETYTNYIMGPPQFSFPPISLCLCLFHFQLLGSNVTAMFTNGVSTVWTCTTTTLQSIPMVGICAPWWQSIPPLLQLGRVWYYIVVI